MNNIKISLPERNSQNRTKKKVALFSLLVSVLLVGIKVTIAYLTNSSGVFSEALNNGLDLVTVLIAFLAIRMATKPADKDHTYGHAKYENLSAFIELAIIALLCFYIIFISIRRMIYRDFEINLNIYIFLVLIISVAINLVRVYYVGKAARKFNSFALQAEFVNYSSDIVSSILVIAGLYLAGRGFVYADPIASILVAVIVLIFSLRLSVKIIRNLLDHIPGEVTEKIDSILDRIPQIKTVNKLQIHEVGNIKFINLDVGLDDNLYLSQVEKIKRAVRSKILSDLPGSEIILETRSSLEATNIRSIVKEVILNYKEIKDIHNIFIYDVGEYMDISIHVELRKNLKLDETEKLTKNAENKITKKINRVRRIYIHIEDAKSDEDWEDITKTSEKLINRLKAEISLLVNPDTCHNFTLLERKGSYNLAFHCRLKKSLDIKEAHLIITEIENRIRHKFKDLNEVAIHMEPE